MKHPVAFQRYAFFDLDGTLISEPSLISFLDYYCNESGAPDGLERWEAFCRVIADLRSAETPCEEQNLWYYNTQLAGFAVDELETLVGAWLRSRLPRPGFLKYATHELLQYYRATDVGVVLVTGSFREIASAVACIVGATDWLCAPLEEREGCYTGNLTAAPMIGEGKAVAVTRFLELRGVSPDICFGYGDDTSDIPFLKLLGHPHVVDTGNAELLHVARQLQWSLVCAADGGREARNSPGLPYYPGLPY